MPREAMTFGEKRRMLRLFRATAEEMRARVHAIGRLGPPPEGFSLTLDRTRFDACVFGLAHLMVWIPDVGEDGELLKTGRLDRQHTVFRFAREPREHFVFKSYPVFVVNDAAA